MVELIRAAAALALLSLLAPAAAGPSLIERHYGESHALLIGMSDYRGAPGWDSLPSVPDELARVAALLRRQGFRVQLHLDLGAAALRRVLRAFAVEEGYEADNRLLIYLAGHGETERRRYGDEMGYFVPVDAPALHRDPRGFNARALSMAQVATIAREIRAKHAMFVFDSCFSGSIFKSRGLSRPPVSAVERLIDKPVRYFITSGSAEETVPADSEFARAFVAAFEQSLADLNGDGYITGVELGLHLSQHTAFARQTPQHGKIDDYTLSQGDMVFAAPAGPREAVASARPAPVLPVLDREQALWNITVSLDRPAAYRAYLDAYPEGAFVALARAALAGQAGAPLAVAAELAALEALPSLRLLPVRIDTNSQHWSGDWQSAAQLREQSSARIWAMLSRRGIAAAPYRRGDGWQRGLFSVGISAAVIGDGEQQGLGLHLRLGADNMAGQLQLHYRDRRGERKSGLYRVGSTAAIDAALARALAELALP